MSFATPSIQARTVPRAARARELIVAQKNTKGDESFPPFGGHLGGFRPPGSRNIPYPAKPERKTLSVAEPTDFIQACYPRGPISANALERLRGLVHYVTRTFGLLKKSLG